MKIALDYDGTFTEDPGMWLRFIDDATRLHSNDNRLSCHQVYLVTYRGEDTPINFIHDEALCDLGASVYYTNGIAKRRYMEERDIGIDVWIDDNPDLIVHETEWTPEERLAWRKANGFE